MITNNQRPNDQLITNDQMNQLAMLTTDNELVIDCQLVMSIGSVGWLDLTLDFVIE